MASKFIGDIQASALTSSGPTSFTGSINSSGLYGFHLNQGGWSGIMFSGTNATKSVGMHYGGSSDNKLRLGRYADNGGAWEGNPIMFDIDDGLIQTSGAVSASSISSSNSVYAKSFIDADDNSYFVDPAGTSYLNQIDGLNFKAKHLTSIGLGSSYDERVILLCPKIDTNTSLDNHVHGKIMMRKTGGNVVDFFDVYVNCVYNDNRAVMHSMGQRNDHKFVTCTYNGITWVAIKVGFTANPYNEAWFQGFADTSFSAQAKADQLKVISYYDTNPGTILNAEIYNSIADYTPNGLAFKSTASSNNFDGPITSAADITAYSDARLKSDVITFPNALDTVKALRGTAYVKDGKASVGVIAQEVEEVLPQVVHTADDEMGTKSVAYGNMVGVLIEAIKELEAKVAELEEKLNGK